MSDNMMMRYAFGLKPAENPPEMPKVKQYQCEHNYQLMISRYEEDGYTGFTTTYKRINTYYCTKCLDEKTKIKEESSRYAPEWYKNYTSEENNERRAI